MRRCWFCSGPMPTSHYPLFISLMTFHAYCGIWVSPSDRSDDVRLLVRKEVVERRQQQPKTQTRPAAQWQRLLAKTPCGWTSTRDTGILGTYMLAASRTRSPRPEESEVRVPNPWSRREPASTRSPTACMSLLYTFPAINMKVDNPLFVEESGLSKGHCPLP